MIRSSLALSAVGGAFVWLAARSSYGSDIFFSEEWQDARYFSERKMAELYDESRAARAEEPPTLERIGEWRLVAKRAIESSLELADEMEAA